MKNPTRGLQTRFCFAVAASLVLLLLVSASAQRRLTRPGMWEGEHLVNSGKVTVNGGSVAAQPMSGFGAGWSGDSQLFWGGGQIGAVLDLTIDIGEEGIYEVELHMTRAPDFGTLRIQVDGKNVAEAFDGYAPTVVPSGAIPLGTFALETGARNISFTIEGKNESSSNYFAGIDFLTLKKIPTAAGQTQSGLGTTANWRIISISILPQPTEPGSGGDKAYKDRQEITVKCAYEPIVTNQWHAIIAIRIRNAPMSPIVVKHQVPVTKAGEVKTSFQVFTGSGTSYIGCGVGTSEDGKSWNYVDEKIINVQVVSPKWPTAPIIDEPVTGGKLLIRPRNASASHCTDGGFFFFDWQYLNKGFKTYEPSKWKPLKVLSTPLACNPQGAIKEVSGMQPGVYKVRAKESNGKYNFTSDWSDWVQFEIVSK